VTVEAQVLRHAQTYSIPLQGHISSNTRASVTPW